MKRILSHSTGEQRVSRELFSLRAVSRPARHADAARAALTQTGIALPLVLTAVFAFLTIRHEGTSILDFIRYAAAFLITKQQYYEWRLDS